MKNRIRFLLLSAIVFQLSGCSPKQTDTANGYRLFCVNTESSTLAEQNYAPEASEGETLVSELAGAMKNEISLFGCESAVPEGVSAEIVTLKDGRLTMDFNAGYKTLDAAQEILFRAALVQTLTQCAEVDEIVFTVEGEALLDASNEAIGPMRADSFLNSTRKLTEAFENQTTETTHPSDGETETEDEKTPAIGVDPELKNEKSEESPSLSN